MLPLRLVAINIITKKQLPPSKRGKPVVTKLIMRILFMI